MRWFARSGRLAAGSLAVIVAMFGAERSVAAQPATRASARGAPCAPTGPFVVATVDAPPPRGLDVGRVFERLSDELAARGIALCTARPPATAPSEIGTVKLRDGAGGGAVDSAARGAIAIEVEAKQGAATKAMTKTIALDDVPRDTRPTLIALEADELLRAATEAIALDRAATDGASVRNDPRPPAAPAPRSREDADHAGGLRASHPMLALGVRGGAEAWTGGLALFGGDGVAFLRVGPLVRLEIDAGARASFATATKDGAVIARAGCLRLGAALPVLRFDRAEIDVAARTGAYAVWMIGEPTGAATGTTLASGALTAELGPALRVPLAQRGPSLVVDADVATALHGVSAHDGDTAVAGITGIALVGSIGVVMGAP